MIDRVHLSGDAYRSELASKITKGKFDKVMKALGREERAKALDDEARRVALLEAFEAVGSLSAAQCKVVAPIFGAYNKSTKAAIRTALRYGVPDELQVNVRVTKLDTKGAPKVDYPPGVASDVLSRLGLGCDRTNGDYDFKKKQGNVTCFYRDATKADALEVGWTHRSARVRSV